jgi:polyisoprenoid-binding protein YceI
MNRARLLLTGLMLATAVPALAQNTPPGAPDPSRVTAGTYMVDPAHSQITFTVNHLGFSNYSGIFGNPTGTLTLDPKDPAKAKVSIDVPINKLVTTVEKLTEHLLSPDFFEQASYPTAHFESTSIEPSGTKAKISGNLTIKGVTKPVVLDATFVGAGAMRGKQTIGFDATTTIKRSEFNILRSIPGISDAVPLTIAVAFEK